ncbi:ABC transporter transmembrane domain-containing protein [Sphingomonas floccifaciens]|uniref:ABC transporter transmembrane domain-containing protein n=1 Tax=Sphingomonas floccifaciens TaxID=1844115 RepID=A0ABW4NIP3_9SPHN
MATAPTPVPSKAKIDNLKIVWRMAARYPGRIAAALAAMLVAALATLAIPSSFKLIIDRGFMAGGGGDIGRWFQYLLLLVLIMAVATAFRFYFVSWLGERVVADLRIAVQANLLRLSPSFFEENRPSEIASRMTSDTTIIEQLVGSTISIAVRNLVIGVGGILYLFTLSPKLTGLLVLGIPLVILPIMILGRRVRTISRASQDRVADVGAMTSEVLGAMKIVQAFGQQRREGQRFADAVERVLATAKTRILLRAIMTATVIGLIFSAITLVMWQGAIDVSQGRMSGGSIAAFVLTGVFVAGSFGALTEVWGDLLRGSGAAQRLAELLAETPGIAAPAQPATLPEPARGEIAFSGVEFRYPTRQEVSALHDFSLTVRPGETVALVGPSGAGKTTVFQLVQRFYDPVAGSVAVDGLDVRSVDPEALRQRIAVVPQETVIFAASARDNLRYGRWDADDDALWDAAEAANAADFLRDLPDGLDTFLGEGGARLSGGQRQRVAIARALLRDAPILLLDEATSALDAESERLVQSALERLMQSRTTLVIAHRLATVRAADRIVVMDGGKIVEEGPHAELERGGGLYQRLAGLQFG